MFLSKLTLDIRDRLVRRDLARCFVRAEWIDVVAQPTEVSA
jgi:hypothetical protein